MRWRNPSIASLLVDRLATFSQDLEKVLWFPLLQIFSSFMNVVGIRGCMYSSSTTVIQSDLSLLVSLRPPLDGVGLSGYCLSIHVHVNNCQIVAVVSGTLMILIFLTFPESNYFNRNTAIPPVGDTESRTSGDTKEQGYVENVHIAASAVEFKRKPYIQQLKPWSPLNPNTTILNLFLRPFPLVVYPGAIYAFLAFATQLGWGMLVLNTTATVFQNKPYNMTPGISSLIRIPSLIGSIVGTTCGGALADWYIALRARQNKGVHQPETRLELMTIPFFLIPVGLLMYLTCIL